MILEYRYGTAYYSDLKPGDLIQVANGEVVIITQDMINEKGELKNIIEVSNTVNSLKGDEKL